MTWPCLHPVTAPSDSDPTVRECLRCGRVVTRRDKEVTD